MTLIIDLPDDRIEELQARASAQGISAEQYARRVIEHDLEPGQSVAEMMREIWGEMPAEVRSKLPRDGASQIDHYIYGLPKREL